MSEIELRNKIGIFLIISQIILVVIVFLSFLLNGYSFDEMTTTIGLMFPMLTVYTTGIAKYFVSNREENNTQAKKVTDQFKILAWLFPIVFIFSLGFVVSIKPFNVFDDFEQFKTAIAIIESLFGGFTGYIITALLEQDN